ncbi:MAG: hypothetical protein ABMA02_04975 [Saprospiraceae bacterium]
MRTALNLSAPGTPDGFPDECPARRGFFHHVFLVTAMKNTHYFFLLVAFVCCLRPALAQPCYKEMRSDGLKYMNAKNYGLASNTFWAAMLTCADKPDDNDLSDLLQKCQAKWVHDLEASVQQQKEAYQAAENARQAAETAKQSEAAARQEAENNARKAREQGIRAESLRMALVSDMVRQKGRTSDAMRLAYLALQMAGTNASPPMMRAFSDAVRDSFVVPFYNSPDQIAHIEPLAGGAAGFLLKKKGGGYLIVQPAQKDRQMQVTEINAGNTTVVASPQGDRFVGWGAGPSARIFDAAGTEMAALNGHAEPIRAAAFSPDGRLVVTGSRDNTARIWANTGKSLAVLEGHSGNVQWVSFSPDGTAVLTRASDGTARIWSVQGALVGVLQADGAYLLDLRMAPDGKRFAALFSDGQARLYAADGKVVAALNPTGQTVKDACFAAANPRLAVRLGNKTVRLCTPDGDPLAACEHPTNVVGMTLRPDGNELLTWADDHVLRLWDGRGQLLRELRGHRAGVTNAAFSPDGKFILSTSKDGTAKLWDTDGSIWTDWASGPNPLARFAPDGGEFMTNVNGGRSVARMPLPALVYQQIDRTSVLAATSTKALLEEFRVQFADALEKK